MENNVHIDTSEMTVSYNMTAVERVLSDIEQISACKHGLLMSLVYSSTARLLSAWTQMNNIQDADHDDFSVNFRRNEVNGDHILQLEQRYQENSDLISWANEQLPQDMKVPVEDLLHLFIDKDTSVRETEESLIENIAEALGIDKKEAMRAAKISEKELFHRSKIQQKALRKERESISVMLSQLLDSPSREFEISDRLAMTVMDKFCNKIDQYIETRLGRLFRQRRASRQAEIAGEIAILKGILSTADALYEKLEIAVNRPGPANSELFASH